jgi:predicted RND superfamily exporter protein
LLTTRQKSSPFSGKASDPKPAAIHQYSTSTEKFLHDSYSSVITSRTGLMVIFSVYIVLIAVSCYGVSILEIDFKTTYFVKEESMVGNYINKQEEYFKSGEQITFYVDSPETDFTSTERPKKLDTLNSKITSCDGCS